MPRFLMPALGVVLLGAAGVSSAAGQAQVRDSAGVLIVTSTAGRWSAGQGWRLSDAPVWTVRVEAGSAPAVGVWQLSGDRVAVLTANWLRLYDARGRFATWAAQGNGGLRMPTWLGHGRGDTLLVWDRQAQRLLWIGARGVVRNAAASQLGALFPQVLGVYTDGSFLGTPGPDLARLSTAPEGTFRGVQPYLRFSVRGELLGSVGRFASEDLHVLRSGSRSTWEPIPFGRRTVVAVAGSRHYVAHTGRFEISVYTSQGRLERLIRARKAALPVRPSDVDAFRRQRVAAATPERAAELERVLRSAAVPSTMPAIAALVVDATDHLWVQEFSPPTASADRWAVFDPAGRMLGQVNVPAGFQILQVGRDFVLGVGPASGGTQQVQRYALVRR